VPAMTEQPRLNRSDKEVASGCLKGNESAWEDFIRSHRRRIYSMSYRFTRCSAEAEDLTQDVLVRIYQTLYSYRADTGTLSGWVMRVAHNLLIDRHRQARRNVRFSPILETELAIKDPRAPNPLQRIARDETAAIVHSALQRLSPAERNAVVLHDLNGLALCEVAAILDTPVGTVKSRVSRGRRELARILLKGGGRPRWRHPGPSPAAEIDNSVRWKPIKQKSHGFHGLIESV